MIAWTFMFGLQIISDVTLHFEYILMNVAVLLTDIALIFEGIIHCVEEFDEVTDS